MEWEGLPWKSREVSRKFTVTLIGPEGYKSSTCEKEKPERKVYKPISLTPLIDIIWR